MSGPFALVDCNNFYVSCERVFAPRLHGVPVGILSNNDGCVIARSEELKRLGVAMGVPAHLIAPALKRKIVLCSSNYELYGDMSARVLEVMRAHYKGVEPYSIDEAWIDLTGHAVTIDELNALRQSIRRLTGIPVSIGLAPTRTLAKLANRYAKRASSGVYVMPAPSDPAHPALLRATPVDQVWGIGTRLALRLKAQGILTAHALSTADPHALRRAFSVVLARTAMELAGTACFEMNDADSDKHALMTSRSLSRATQCPTALMQAIRQHTNRSAEKLRQQGSTARAVMLTMSTSKHIGPARHHGRVVIELEHPSQDTFMFLRAARQGFEALYRKGVRYQKCGVMLMDLARTDQQQLSLLGNVSGEATLNDALMSTLDRANRRFGQRALTVGFIDGAGPWQLKCDHRSSRCTTRWDELARVRRT
ncbi:Y-family DNA polymerase [Larsenimonas suaedae]|uniref:Y-family DNA polymerase n=1 Tax=Larsenimonas suaedae TaxID=1851019 RepID=A0ABU1GTE3_9GAMM|nr:Y-family DNA polymerase [Larsenimonas suaedae]MCM2971745.1 Y-family DNA polymerase [Larsenimonas suaedae]MDR5895297.1 Y-family DNA polymerase [Larsenimonas suaedae]